MTSLKYSVATLALLCASGFAYAQDSTTVQPQPGAATTIECPAPGSVPEADLKPECKPGASTSAAPEAGSDPATTGTAEAPKTDSDPAATGTIEVPKTTAEVPKAGTDTDSASADVNPATAVLASRFMGQKVYSAGDERVGEINDLVMNSELATVVAIIGVGGFLGIGEKDVAIPVNDITVTKDADNNLRLTIASSKEQLEAAPAFDRTVMK